MNRLPLFLLIIMPSVFAHAQFYLVSDSDGYANVRSNADVTGKIVDTLNNGRMIYLLEQKTNNNWSRIQYWRKNKECEGYIYHNRLKRIDGYDSIPLEDWDDDVAVHRKDSIKIGLTRQKFNKANYRFSYYKNTPNEIELINGKTFWGTDAEVPVTEYKSIVIIVGNRKITLPKTALANLFTPDIGHEDVFYDRQNDILYIHARNWRNAAASYDVIWRVVKGVYTDRECGVIY
jgi:Bacterial SH3 domain